MVKQQITQQLYDIAASLALTMGLEALQEPEDENNLIIDRTILDKLITDIAKYKYYFNTTIKYSDNPYLHWVHTKIERRLEKLKGGK